MPKSPVAAPRPDLLAPFERQWAVLPKTQKRDGTWIGTPVNVAVDGGCAYVGSPATTAKVKRLRNFPDVEIAPCTFRGRLTGQSLHARSRLLDGKEAAAAARRLRRKYRIIYGVVVPVELRIKRVRGLYYELSEFRPATHPLSTYSARSPSSAPRCIMQA